MPTIESLYILSSINNLDIDLDAALTYLVLIGWIFVLDNLVDISLKFANSDRQYFFRFKRTLNLD